MQLMRLVTAQTVLLQIVLRLFKLARLIQAPELIRGLLLLELLQFQLLPLAEVLLVDELLVAVDVVVPPAAVVVVLVIQTMLV